MPVLLYGSENWIMTEGLLERLEAFQGSWQKGYSSGQGITPSFQHCCHHSFGASYDEE